MSIQKGRAGRDPFIGSEGSGWLTAQAPTHLQPSTFNLATVWAAGADGGAAVCDFIRGRSAMKSARGQGSVVFTRELRREYRARGSAAHIRSRGRFHAD